MGCQKEIAQKIVAARGDYVLAVKDNQPKLHQAIREVFSDRRQGDPVKMPHRRHPIADNGHGRKDQRYDVLAKTPEDFPLKDQWPGLKAIGMAVRTMQRPDGPTTGADNLSRLRRFAISLWKRHPSEESIKSKSRMAGWSNEFLMETPTAKGI